jgi:hypothetical protein
MAEPLGDLLVGLVVGGLAAALSAVPALAPPPAARASLANRFALGFVLGALDPPAAAWVCGALGGLVLAVLEMTRARWAPLLGVGAAAAALWLTLA